LVLRGKEGGDARQQIVVTMVVGAKDHVAIVVGLQIGNLAQQDDGVDAGGEAFGLPCGGDGVLFDLVALSGIKRHVLPP